VEASQEEDGAAEQQGDGAHLLAGEAAEGHAHGGGEHRPEQGGEVEHPARPLATVELARRPGVAVAQPAGGEEARGWETLSRAPWA